MHYGSIDRVSFWTDSCVVMHHSPCASPTSWRRLPTGNGHFVQSMFCWNLVRKDSCLLQDVHIVFFSYCFYSTVNLFWKFWFKSISKQRFFHILNHNISISFLAQCFVISGNNTTQHQAAIFAHYLLCK